VVSGGIGATWELAAAEHIKKHVFGDVSPAKAAFGLAGIDTVPAPVIEAIDTFFVLSIMRAMKGLAPFTKDTVPSSISAGLISGAGAYPNNLMQYLSTHSKALDGLISTLTNQLAIYTAASGVPMELKENKDSFRENYEHQIQSGFLAVPAGQDQAAFIDGLVKRSMATAPDTSIATKSMGLAALIAFGTVAVSDKYLPEHHSVPESASRIWRSTIYQAIEAWSLHALVAKSKVHIPVLHPSDYQRQAQVSRMIFNNAVDGNKDISTAELMAALAPGHELLRHMGDGIVWGMTPISWVGAKMSEGMLWGAGQVAGAASALLGRSAPTESAETPHPAATHAEA
jgi:hypothetical protein